MPWPLHPYGELGWWFWDFSLKERQELATRTLAIHGFHRYVRLRSVSPFTSGRFQRRSYSGSADIPKEEATKAVFSFAPEVSAWRFDRVDGRTVIALYAKQNGDRTWILDAAPASTRVVNFFGRTVSTGDRVEIPLSRNPVFVSTETNDVAVLERVLASGRR